MSAASQDPLHSKTQQMIAKSTLKELHTLMDDYSKGCYQQGSLITESNKTFFCASTASSSAVLWNLQASQLCKKNASYSMQRSSQSMREHNTFYCTSLALFRLFFIIIFPLPQAFLPKRPRSDIVPGCVEIGILF